MAQPMPRCIVERLAPGETTKAKRLFGMMAEVFDPQCEGSRDELSDAYVDTLLAREDFWVLAASVAGELVGGATAHVLCLTHSEARELFIYDVAVRHDHQRRGVGRQLIRELRALAADADIDELFVAADNEDQHALDFYRAVGGRATRVTLFTFAAAGHTRPGP